MKTTRKPTATKITRSVLMGISMVGVVGLGVSLASPARAETVTPPKPTSTRLLGPTGPSNGPCAVLATGGTVFDTTECEPLERHGRHTAGLQRTVLFVGPHPIRGFAVAARIVADNNGVLGLPVPSTFNGTLAQEAPGDNVGFCFRTLPSEPVHLEVMCVDDYEWL